MLPSLGFPKALRLRKKPDFQSVFNHQRRLNGRYYRVIYRIRPNVTSAPAVAVHSLQNVDSPRLGLMLSKRLVKTAVKRNLMKRLAKETFRLNQHRLHALDCILLATQQSRRATQRELTTCLNRLIEQLAVQCKQRCA